MELDKLYKLSYLCPECKHRVYRDIQYINPALFSEPAEARITISLWCKECNARHEFTFSLKEIEENKEKKIRVSTHSFFSNEVEYRKKLRLRKECEVPT